MNGSLMPWVVEATTPQGYTLIARWNVADDAFEDFANLTRAGYGARMWDCFGQLVVSSPAVAEVAA